MMRGTFGMPDGAGRSQRAALAELIIQRSQRAAPSEPTLMMRGTFVMPGGARLDTSISADWMLHEEWQNLPTQTLTVLRDYINRFAHVYILCVSADVQKRHSLNVGMMKMGRSSGRPSFSTPTGSLGAAASAAPTSPKNKRKTRWLDFACELAAERAE